LNNMTGLEEKEKNQSEIGNFGPSMNYLLIKLSLSF